MMSFKTFTVGNDYIIEAVGGMLDKSIPNADKSFKDKYTMLQGQYEIEEKTDGVKLTIFRNDKNYNSKDFTENWIVAYKNNILHPNEFKSVAPKKAKEQGIGISQYKMVFDHLKKIHKKAKDIPTNTEFFVEYLMQKPTLTRSYDNKHGMVLIGYSHNVKIDSMTNFRLYTKETKLNQDLNEHYSKILDFDLPAKIFEGTLISYESLKDGAINKDLKSLIRKNKKEVEENYQRENWNYLYELIKELFLEVPSVYGGKTEGVVLKNVDNKKMYKFLQSDQHSKIIRGTVKEKFQMNKEKENVYFNELKKIASEILKDINMSRDHAEVMELISLEVHKRKLPKGLHTKKSDHQIKEDLHLTVKLKYEKMLNGWAGIVGKFRIITKEHANMISYALEKYKGVSLMLVTGKRDVLLTEENKKILTGIFKGKNIEFFISSSGNIINLERKTRNPIVAYVAGPDRRLDYQKQIDLAKTDAIVDIYDGGKRENVSASKAEEALRNNDVQTLKKIVHPIALKNIDKWEKFYT